MANGEGVPGAIECHMILVVGDIMLDEYVRGKATRMAPEAPVPVVLMDGTEPELRLGGAANVAASVAALGEDVALVGPYGRDRSDDVQKLCMEHGIKLVGEPDDDGTSRSRRTTVKTRVVDESGRLLIRMDNESVEPWESADILDALLSKKPDTVVFADYAKGCWTPANWSTILGYFRAAAGGGPRRLVVDAKRRFDSYEGAGIVKCNLSEWTRFDGETTCPPGSHAIVTKGKAGLSHSGIPVARVPGSCTRTWTDVAGDPHDVHDVTGAGDVVGAVVAVGLSRGMPMQRILESAVRAGGMSVTQPMTGVADPAQAGLDDA